MNRMIKRISLCLMWLVCCLIANAKHTPVQMIVDGKPFLILGGELGNSSASSPKDIERIFPKLSRMGLNTVLVPVYWELMEEKEGVYDFSLIDSAITQAEKNQLKVVFLWFGAWKNSMSCYAPAWFKKDYKKYPRAKTRSGKPVEVASVFSKNVLAADKRAFSNLVRHIADTDKNQTVVMLQIENEVGMIEESKDFSSVADKEFSKAVPESLFRYMERNKKVLHPSLLRKWQEHDAKKSGNWEEVFGKDIYTNEIFMAWHYASYIEELAKEARAVLRMPLYVNAALNSRGRVPGEYPSAGPLAHLKDIWKCAAPDLDFLAPDLYDKGFKDWVKQYDLPDNTLFIPEIRLEDNDGVRALYVFGEHDALGFSPFSIEDGSDNPNGPLVKSYKMLKELMPLICQYRGFGKMKGFLFDGKERDTTFLWSGLKITAAHYFTLPWDPRATDGSVWSESGGLMVQLSKDEYLIAGSGIVCTFANEKESEDVKKRGEDGFLVSGNNKAVSGGTWSGSARCGILSVDEVNVSPDGDFRYIRRLNGDQDHQGRHVRISVGDYKILHVKLYQYQ